MSFTLGMILHPTYFAPLIQYIALVNAREVTFEIEDNYQKQTYRNRCYIYGANGKQLLTVPVMHSKNNKRQKTKEVKIDNSFSWQKLHVKAIQIAYRSSPYFEFYEDEIIPVIIKNHKFLIDLNLETNQIIFDVLQHEFSSKRTNDYQEKYTDMQDFRGLVNAKSTTKYNFQLYQQVFADKHNFIPNLSILDLLFSEGPNTINYLEGHKNLLF
ncbi:MAG: WbqC family protein [Bacteroidota bacterium]